MKVIILAVALLTGCTTTDTYCDTYKVQLITKEDSKEIQMQKLSENTYYQSVCKNKK